MFIVETYKKFDLKPIESPCRTFDLIDETIVTQVLPKLSYEYGGNIWILPNGNPALFPSHKGPIRNHDPKRFFAVCCLEQGLTLPETGL